MNHCRAGIDDIAEYTHHYACDPEPYLRPAGYVGGICADCDDPIMWPATAPKRPRKICWRCATVSTLALEYPRRT